MQAIYRYRRLLGVVLFVVVLLIAVEASGLREHFSLESIRDAMQMHPVGGLLLFVALFALGNLVQIPGWVFVAAAVLTLGRLWGGVVTYVAAVTSCALTFVTIRLIGGDTLRLVQNRVAVRILRELDRHPVRSVALLRLLFQTAPPLNYALALSGIGLPAYLVGTLIGLPLPIAAYCIFFDLLATGLHAR